MKKAEEYRQHAQECRDLAKGMDAGAHRDQLLQMAETWERLAAERAHRMQSDDASPGGNDDRPGGGVPSA